jgi:hypothetical protein
MGAREEVDSCQHGIVAIFRVVGTHLGSHELKMAAEDGGRLQLAPWQLRLRHCLFRDQLSHDGKCMHDSINLT